ncbi:hypothetical protein [Romboutsia sp.]|uniref:hypothetical protein n=1 Tax=Romboutsia sp. TaxID=1965302 RepID=UPI002B7AF9AE|nr:hypothetical protein [Romboutsia sp.]HSQ89784.1 hypothetical protein [Romboutsia sp.]
MKKILCDNKTCIHNEVLERNNLTVCKRCDDITINSYADSCNGYEEIKKYLDRIK